MVACLVSMTPRDVEMKAKFLRMRSEILVFLSYNHGNSIYARKMGKFKKLL